MNLSLYQDVYNSKESHCCEKCALSS